MIYHVHYHSKSGYAFNHGVVAENVDAVLSGLRNESVKWIRKDHAAGAVVWKAPRVQLKAHHGNERVKAGRSLVVQRL